MLKSASPAKNAARKSKKSWLVMLPSPLKSAGHAGVQRNPNARTSSIAASTREPVPVSEAMKRIRIWFVAGRIEVTLSSWKNHPPEVSTPPGPIVSAVTQEAPLLLETWTVKMSVLGAPPASLEYQRQ